MYTQPKLYEKINRHPDTLTVFGKQLLDEGTCSAQTLEEIKAMVNRTLEADFQAAKTWEVHNPTQQSGLSTMSLIVHLHSRRRSSTTGSRPRSGQRGLFPFTPRHDVCLCVCPSVCQWSGFLSPRQRSRIRETGVEEARLREIGAKICTFPPSLQVHKQLQKIIQARLDTIVRGEGIDWGTAEALAFGTLLLEGNHVRLRCT